MRSALFLASIAAACGVAAGCLAPSEVQPFAMVIGGTFAAAGALLISAHGIMITAAHEHARRIAHLRREILASRSAHGDGGV